MADDFSKEEKEKLIKAWQESALEDFRVAEELFASKHFNHTLFYCQLTLEKVLKAIFIKTNNYYPIPTHNLILLAKKSKIPFTADDENTLREITSFNIEARYDILKNKLFHKATEDFTRSYLEITKNYLDSYEKLL